MSVCYKIEEKMRRDKVKKKDLVPFEKSKRVIYLEGRGREYSSGVAHPVWTAFWALVGILCLLYCVGIALSGFGTFFFWIWGVLGVACLLLSYICSNRKLLTVIPKWVKVAFWSLFCIGMTLLCIVEGMICLKFNSSPSPGADYCIILGAQWKSTGPSEVLRRRLDAAIEYLVENPKTKVIVSGGQGGNEMISEAAGMQGYLMDAGIAESRIIMEDKSSNTYENLVFSADFLDEAVDRVVIVTNNFHTFRALGIAEKQGYENVEGLSASSVAGFLPNNMLREFVGVIKDFVVGNL